MRRYDIVSGILLILSFIDFALAAPVLVQEKRQAGVDVVHIPRDVTTVLEKRVGDGEGLEKLADDFFNTGGKPVDSSDSHASSSSAPSSSAPPGPDHGSTNVVQAPESDSSKYGSDDKSESATAHAANPLPGAGPPSSKDIGLAPEHQMGHVQQPAAGPPTLDPNFDKGPWKPYPKPWTAARIDRNRWGIPGSELTTGPDPNFDRDGWLSLDNPLPPAPEPIDPNRWGKPGSLLTSKPLDPSPNWKVSAHQPSPNPMSSTEPAHEVVTPPSTGAELATEPGHEVGTPSPNLGSPKEPGDEVVPGPSSSPAPESSSDHQSSSADSQPVDLQAATDNVLNSKGKQIAERSRDRKCK